MTDKYPGENEKQQGVCWLSPGLLPHLPPLLSPSSTLLGSPLPLVPLLGFALETFSLFQPTSHELTRPLMPWAQATPLELLLMK